jgi:hypothetical protein
MKIAHYQYVGWSRAGSTFLYRIFNKNPLLQDCVNTVFKEKSCHTLDDYEEYRQFDYSINMNTRTLVQFDHSVNPEKEFISSIQVADSVTNKFFACVRNPYDRISSVYTFTNGKIDIVRTDYASTLERFKTQITKPFKLFFFDDLIADTPGFVNSVHDYLELPYTVVDFDQIQKLESSAVYLDLSKIMNYVNPTDICVRTDETPCVHRTFTDKDIITINHMITRFEDYIGRDFSHWKR